MQNACLNNLPGHEKCSSENLNTPYLGQYLFYLPEDAYPHFPIELSGLGVLSAWMIRGYDSGHTIKMVEPSVLKTLFYFCFFWA